MNIQRYRLREGKIPYITIFAVGAFFGIILMNLGQGILLENTGLLDEYTLYHMKYMTVDSSALFYYILCHRLGSVLILALLSTTYLGIVVCSGMALWYGVCVGAFLATAVIRYGIRGILLVLAGIFPQFLVYIPAMIVLFLWCNNIYKLIYLDGTGGLNSVGYFFISKRLLQLVGILLIFIVGCILEGFLNPFFLKGLLKIF